MTREERNTKLKHFITCLKCEVSGKACDDNCPIQYEAGNMGEIIENLEAILKDPCEDCIRRQEVLDLCESKDPDYKVIHFKEDVECLPSVTPQQKTGRWIFDEILDKHYYCSECKSMGVDHWDYCPNCGVKMQEVEE